MAVENMTCLKERLPGLGIEPVNSRTLIYLGIKALQGLSSFTERSYFVARVLKWVKML